MIRGVLVPTDLGPEFRGIVELSAGLGVLGVRRVVFGHVIDASGMEGPVIAARMDRVRESVLTATTLLESTGLEREVRISTGGSGTAAGIFALASASGVDAIVCGTSGKGVVGRVVAGSVSEELVAASDVPVMLVRFEKLRLARDRSTLPREFARTLVLTTDFSAASTRAFMHVLDLPVGVVERVHIVHAIDPDLGGSEARLAEESARFHLSNWASMAEQKGIAPHTAVHHGDPARTALAAVDSVEATGLVVGTRGRGPLTGVLLGSVSMTLVRNATCPVLVVP